MKDIANGKFQIEIEEDNEPEREKDPDRIPTDKEQAINKALLYAVNLITQKPKIK